MELKVKYFGALAEEAGLEEEVLNFDKTSTGISELKAFCESKYSGISALSYQISVNKKLVTAGDIQDGDEVAFLPPFAGG